MKLNRLDMECVRVSPCTVLARIYSLFTCTARVSVGACVPTVYYELGGFELELVLAKYCWLPWVYANRRWSIEESGSRIWSIREVW